MNLIPTAIPEVLIIEPKVVSDSRGHFTEIYQRDRYSTVEVGPCFVQDNLSRSAVGVLRGLHFQNPNPQGKLVTVLRGSVLDVAVDVRVGSPTFGEHVKVELNDKNYRQLWIPPGFAHGFLTLSDTADVLYKCTAFYSPSDELVLRWNDPQLSIEWGCDSPKLSQRDAQGGTLCQLSERLAHYDPR